MKYYLLLLGWTLSTNCVGQFVKPIELEDIKFKCKLLVYINSYWGELKLNEDIIDHRYTVESIDVNRASMMLFF